MLRTNGFFPRKLPKTNQTDFEDVALETESISESSAENEVISIDIFPSHVLA